MNLNLTTILKENRGTLFECDERDLALIAGSHDVGAVQSLHKILRAYQKQIQREINNKAKLSDVFIEDVRYMVGMSKLIDEVLALPVAAKALQNRIAPK